MTNVVVPAAAGEFTVTPLERVVVVVVVPALVVVVVVVTTAAASEAPSVGGVGPEGIIPALHGLGTHVARHGSGVNEVSVADPLKPPALPVPPVGPTGPSSEGARSDARPGMFVIVPAQRSTRVIVPPLAPAEPKPPVPGAAKAFPPLPPAPPLTSMARFAGSEVGLRNS